MIPANTLERHGQTRNASGAPLWPNNATTGVWILQKGLRKSLSYILASKRKISNIQYVRFYTAQKITFLHKKYKNSQGITRVKLPDFI